MMQDMDYQRHYSKWHSYNKSHIDSMKLYYYQLIKDYLPYNKKQKILDIGCGMGFFLLMLRDHGYENIYGIEIDLKQVECCQNFDLNVIQVTDTIKYLKELNSEFSLITAFDVVEHFPVNKQIQLIKAIYNSLEDNGVFLCTVPNANSIIAPRWRYIDYTHHSSFTEHSLDFILFNGGFSHIEIFPIDFFYQNFPVSIGSIIFSPITSIKTFIRWTMLHYFRFLLRLQLYAEIGNECWAIPLSLNILGVARKV